MYRNDLLIFDEAQFSKLNHEIQAPNVQKEITPLNDLNNRELEDKVDRLESLILVALLLQLFSIFPNLIAISVVITTGIYQELIRYT